MKSLLITIVIILTTLDTNAQIRGFIIDENSTPLQGSVVILVNKADSSMISSIISGDDGGFSFSNKADTSQLLNISMLGYAPVILPVKSDMGKVCLTIKAIEMATATVKGTAFVTSSDRFTFTISNPVLLAGNNAVGILKLTPLLKANDDGISIVGVGGTKVYVNGKEVRLDGSTLNSYLKSIPAEDVVKIEVMPVANSSFKGQGNFGVVNIILRKSENNGIKGTVGFTDFQAFYNDQSANLSLTGRKNKFGLNASFWGGNGLSRDTYNTESYFKASENIVLSESVTKNQSHNFGTLIGMDYDINDKQTIGILFNSSFKWNKTWLDNTSTYSKANSSYIDSTYYTKTNVKKPSQNININLNYQLKTDNKGSVFTVDVDYTQSNNPQTRITTFNKLNGEEEVVESKLNESNPLRINVWSGNIKYIHYFKSYGSLSVGLDNYTTSYNNTYTNNSINISQDNQFLFTEAISAFFASYSNNWTKKFSTTLGFRVENTYAKGHQEVNNEKFNKNKFKVLPTIYLNYTINKRNGLSYSLSNRLLQPYYSLLNPFKKYTSPTAYNVGNPYLEAINYLMQDFTYMFNGKFMAKASTTFGNNVYSSFVFPEEENGLKTMTTNYGRNYEYRITIGMFGNYFNGIWQANNTALIYYNKEEGEVENVSINNEGLGWNIDLNNDFVLYKKYNLSLSTNIGYAQFSSNQITKYKPFWYCGLGVRTTVGNCSISLYANDIFDTVRERNTYDFQGIIIQRAYNYYSQGISLSLTYNFGNMKTKENRNRQTSNADANSRL